MPSYKPLACFLCIVLLAVLIVPSLKAFAEDAVITPDDAVESESTNEASSTDSAVTVDASSSEETVPLTPQQPIETAATTTLAIPAWFLHDHPWFSHEEGSTTTSQASSTDATSTALFVRRTAPRMHQPRVHAMGTQALERFSGKIISIGKGSVVMRIAGSLHGKDSQGTTGERNVTVLLPHRRTAPGKNSFTASSIAVGATVAVQGTMASSSTSITAKSLRLTAAQHNPHDQP